MAPSLGESRTKSRCDTNFVRGTCSTALGIYSVYYRNTFLTSMILPCTMVFSTMCPPRLLPTLALLLQACSTRRHLRYCFPAFLLQAGHPGSLTRSPQFFWPGDAVMLLLVERSGVLLDTAASTMLLTWRCCSWRGTSACCPTWRLQRCCLLAVLLQAGRPPLRASPRGALHGNAPELQPIS